MNLSIKPGSKVLIKERRGYYSRLAATVKRMVKVTMRNSDVRVEVSIPGIHEDKTATFWINDLELLDPLETAVEMAGETNEND